LNKKIIPIFLGVLDLGPYYVVTASGEAGRLGKEYPPEILDEEGHPRFFAIDGVSIPNFDGFPNRGFNIVCLDRATGNVLAEHVNDIANNVKRHNFTSIKFCKCFILLM